MLNTSRADAPPAPGRPGPGIMSGWVLCATGTDTGSAPLTGARCSGALGLPVGTFKSFCIRSVAVECLMPVLWDPTRIARLVYIRIRKSVTCTEGSTRNFNTTDLPSPAHRGKSSEFSA
ncbi:hypothetical protein RRG08_000755 [Elysia crispata]|uniref:Uncharacterized protein n=1 Tax=Elysia crispata TaxID=231223 RepID=A0AAE1D0E2_9GAST|nr:hypothetical protein RRG08_000755 [Elysia crispata]